MEFVKSVEHLDQDYGANFGEEKMLLGNVGLRRLLSAEKRKQLEGYDLSRGLEDFDITVEAEENGKHWDCSAVFRWLMATHERGSSLKLNVDFACKRSVLFNVALCKLKKRIFVLCVKFAGTIFMFEVNRRVKRFWTEDQRMNLHGGKTFKELLTEPQDNNQLTESQYSHYIVSRVLLGSTSTFKVLISAKVDGVDDEGKLIEIKTCQPSREKPLIRNDFN
ncbi:hypothetical protein M3Y95_01162300 [Aphelenchoides besseyi]|nr:hypothetical protein M3Y95_01162300 [Aphelenchoides besseyi]